MNALAPVGATALVPTNMDEAMRLATAMAHAKMVPKHLQDDVGTCLMVVEQAMRWGMSPFAVAQCTSNIGGKLMYEGKVVAAAVQSQGAIVGHFNYQFSGEGDERTVTVSATRNGEQQARAIVIKLGDVKTTNAMWTKQPDQQLVYSGTRNWARRWTPAALLGVYAPEEFNRQTGEIVGFDGPTLEGTAETPPASPANDKKPKVERTTEQWTVWLEKLKASCATLYKRTEIEDLASRDHVVAALADAPPWAREEIEKTLAEAFARFPDPPA